MERLDGGLHTGHRGGHQGGKAHQRRSGFADCLHHALGRHVPAQIQNVISVIFQNDADNVLADVVDVPLDGGNDNPALALPLAAAGGKGRLDFLEGRLGGGGGLEQLGQEERSLFKTVPHGVQRGDEGGVHQVQRFPGGQCLLCGGAGFLFKAAPHRVIQRIGSLGGGGRSGIRFGHLLRLHLQVGVDSHIIVALFILAGQNAVSPHRRHHLGGVGVHDGQIQPRLHGKGEERRVDVTPAGKAKADVGDAQHRAHAQFPLAAGQGFQRLGGGALLGGNREGQAVDIHILPGDADGVGGGHNAAGDFQTPFHRLGDAALIQRKAHHGGAVLFAQRQNGIQHLLLAVHRVDDGLTVIDAQRTGQRVPVGRIQLQRQVGDRLEFPHQHFQRGGFVNIRQPGVDVQHFGPGLGLGHRLGAGIGAVALPQRLLEAFFAGGIDALAHHGDAVHLHAAHRSAQAAADHRNFGGGGLASGEFFQAGDKLGVGAAAAAQHGNAGGQVGGHLRRKPGGPDVVAAVGVGQPRVGLDKHRHPCGNHPAKTLGERQNLPGAQRAVDAHGVSAKARRRDAVALHRAAGKGSAPGFKAHGGKHRQIAVFLGRQDGGLELIEVGHGLDKDKVRPGGSSGAHHGGKLGAGILKGQGSGGGQQFPDGTNVQRHQRAGLLRSRAGAADGGLNDLLHRVAGARQLAGIGPKGIGQKEVRPRPGIVPVDGGQCFGHGKGRQLRLLLRRQAAALELGAHGAVHQNKTLAGKYFLNFHRSFPSFDRHICSAAGSGHSRRGLR